MAKLTTRIGSPMSDTARLRMRGKDTLAEVVGQMSFSEALFFLVTGRTPAPGEARVFDACLVILMDHGITPTAVVARLVEDSVPDDIQVPIAAGILMVGDKFAGTMAGAARLLAEGCRHQDARAWAVATVASHQAARRRIPGFGHPYYHPEDPRATRLFQIAAENGVAGRHVELVGVLGEEVDRAAGRHVTLNVTGAMAALLCEIGFPATVARGVTVVARAGGLIAHILEEKETHSSVEVMSLVDRAFAYEDPA
jgi:citrate synthase